MKKRLVNAVLVLFTAGTAWAYFGQLLTSFRSPGVYPNGVEWRENNVYIATRDAVWWVAREEGKITEYHPVPLSEPTGMTVGIENGQLNYWIVDQYTKTIYRYLGGCSTLLGSFSAPEARLPFGLAYVDSTKMYTTDVSGSRLFLIHPLTGSIYSSYSLGFWGADLAYDPRGYLWICYASQEIKEVRKCTTTGSVLASFSVAAYGYPVGCGFDGTNVWVGVNDTNNAAFRIMEFSGDVELKTQPASWGRIKAAFR